MNPGHESAPWVDRGEGEARWSHTHTWDHPEWDVDELVAAKNGRTVSVVLPALNEEETVGGVIASIAPLLDSLVDELIVLDSGSTDRTAELAGAAGARVVSREEAIPGVPPVAGKGEALWRSIAVATGDIIAFVDSDLIDPDPMFVPKMIGPLLADPEIHLVKGYYRRPLRTGDTQEPGGGGRVTELLARPLLTALKPELGEVCQPLGGEYAGTRELLASVPFAPGYGVEIGLLIDTYDRYGLAGIGQVNLGVRSHRNRPLHELSVMSRQIVATLLDRCGVADSGVGLTQFVPEPDGGFTPHTTQLQRGERPPIRDLDLSLP
ncbi:MULTISPECIES: glucosyl-3-phosphoglycerate synthase [Gordonia]|uniref:Glucosyl-3-phosphoglycerate synthase n=1 Tax=Gordonia sihwensis NBRC 108236 TaxID=1223544 RepID=L7LKD0_9ACTN|nr:MULTISPECIES: glucosyl-3-phosphoglycerate synthase [Gordonia]KXT57655.1 glucosyl-3-phosphoglycerate synthase [Gordonia sp. QH-12]GAC60478.1 glucosyl-3-phosphoglycerate synthase [Gordonia sihwensis NBRC 108236]